MEQKHYNPNSPVPLEYDSPGLKKQRKPTPEEEEAFRAFLLEHPELRNGRLKMNTLDGPKWLFVFVAVSMILGILIFCVGAFLNDSAPDMSELLMPIGLVLTIGCPTVGAVIDKLRREKKDGPEASLVSFPPPFVPMQTAADNTNFRKHTPALWIMVCGGLGILLLLAVFVLLSVFTGQDAAILSSGAGVLGCLLLTISLAADGRHDGALTWGIFTAAVSGIFLPCLIDLALSGIISADTRIFSMAIFGGVLLCSPLIFIVFRLLTCREKLTASCSDQRVFHSNRHSHHDLYVHYWRYQFDETQYIHEEYCLVRNDAGQDEVPVRINPKHPHMFYRRGFPYCYIFIALTGFFIVALAFVS